MNIRFHNLGKIKETELDLKPMTVIIGPNNSNKTYIAYSVYGLWQSLADVVYADTPALRTRVDGSLSIEIEVLHKTFVAENIRAVDEFVEELDSFYQDSSHGLFVATQYEIAVSLKEFSTSLETLSGTTISAFGAGQFRVSLELDLLVLSPIAKSANNMETTSSAERIRGASKFEVGLMLNYTIRHQIFSEPYLLPAERNAFVITYKVLAQERLKLMLDAQRRLFSSRQSSQRQLDLLKETGEVRYPQPIEDFLEFLFEVETENESRFPARKSQWINPKSKTPPCFTKWDGKAGE